METAKGVRDVPPEEKILKNKVVSTLQEVFELYGFMPLETPILERYETLAAKSGAGEGSDALKETFKLTDQGERKLGLRFELTTSLARYIAMNRDLKFPFKRYEIGTVFRDGPIKLGRYREFWQCDVDIIGSKSMLAEVELISLIDTAFTKLGLDIVIKVNNRKLMNGILTQAGISTNQKQALIAMDKLDKIGKEGVAEELKTLGFEKKQVNTVINLISRNYTIKEFATKITSPEGLEGVKELTELFGYLRALGLEKKVRFEPTLVRGQAYYTGTLIETYLERSKITSSVEGGGRFDNMIAGFTGGDIQTPAVGVSFGLAPIMDALNLITEKGSKTIARVYVIPLKDEKILVERALTVAQQFRQEGIPTDFFLGRKDVKKNMDYATSLGIPYVVIIGEEELKKNKVSLKILESGMQQLLSVKDAVKKLKITNER